VRGLDRAFPDYPAFLAALPHARRADPGDVQPGETVAVTGVAEPEQDGPLRAPVSGLPCVWFRVLEVALAGWSSAVHPPMPPSLASDAAYPGGYLIPRRDDESATAFRIAGHSGAVGVDPAFIDLYTDYLPIDADGGTYESGFSHLREWILPPGTPVFACGRVGPDGVLRAQAGGPLIVSTRDEHVSVLRAQNLARFAGPARS
jgi:hypothetical protein